MLLTYITQMFASWLCAKNLIFDTAKLRYILKINTEEILKNDILSTICNLIFFNFQPYYLFINLFSYLFVFTVS